MLYNYCMIVTFEKKINMKKSLVFIVCLAIGVSLYAQFPSPDVVFGLWPNGAPTENGLTGDEIDYGDHVSNVTEPTLSVFLPEKCNGLAILVCPGGGYVDVWDRGEGYSLADWYTEQGIVYAVLKYRLPNGHTEVPLDDVHRAMDILKEKQAEYGFKKLGIQGCSAGGHLAATAATHFDTPEHRPDFQILFYPVITADLSFSHRGSVYGLLGRTPTPEMIELYSNEKQVTKDTPPAFIMANSDDFLVPVRNSIEYYTALQANRVSATLHVYPVGGHGWFANSNFVYAEQWKSDLKQWLGQIVKSLDN